MAVYCAQVLQQLFLHGNITNISIAAGWRTFAVLVQTNPLEKMIYVLLLGFISLNKSTVPV